MLRIEMPFVSRLCCFLSQQLQVYAVNEAAVMVHQIMERVQDVVYRQALTISTNRQANLPLDRPM